MHLTKKQDLKWGISERLGWGEWIIHGSPRARMFENLLQLSPCL